MGAWRLLDLYPKIPTDLSQSTAVGGWFSTMTGVIMLLLFQVELFSFMSAPIESQVVVDNVLETKVRQRACVEKSRLNQPKVLAALCNRGQERYPSRCVRMRSGSLPSLRCTQQLPKNENTVFCLQLGSNGRGGGGGGRFEGKRETVGLFCRRCYRSTHDPTLAFAGTFCRADGEKEHLLCCTRVKI